MDFDMDFFSDTTAWAITIVLYLVFMALIWVVPDMFGGSWDNLQLERIVITVVSPILLYVVAKWRLG